MNIVTLLLVLMYKYNLIQSSLFRLLETFIELKWNPIGDREYLYHGTFIKSNTVSQIEGLYLCPYLSVCHFLSL